MEFVTAAELIGTLKTHPSDRKVLVPGYEGGAESVYQILVAPFKYEKESWIYGDYRFSEDGGESMIVLIGKGHRGFDL